VPEEGLEMDAPAFFFFGGSLVAVITMLSQQIKGEFFDPDS
jgi:hypothetical protein